MAFFKFIHLFKIVNIKKRRKNMKKRKKILIKDLHQWKKDVIIL